MATVKGDVHDIGKNIVGVVLQCNNFEIIDLGVMVPWQDILKAAGDHDADIIGLSGLITPSLDEMVTVAEEMQKAGMSMPLLIGGATTSKVHTALKIEGAYDGPTLHVLDASRAVGVASALTSEGEGGTALIAQTRTDYEKIRVDRANKGQSKLTPIADARANGFDADFNAYTPPRPNVIGTQLIDDVTVKMLRSYIDWTPFFRSWELAGNYPAILTDEVVGESASALYADAQIMLDKIENEAWLTPRGVAGFWPVKRDGDDIVVYADEGRTEEISRFSMLRQQMVKREGRANMCLADFISPDKDWLGGFTVTAGTGIETHSTRFKADNDDYSDILLKALADRLAEAFAEYLHARARRELWGYSPDEQLSDEDLIREKYRGIRPAPGYPACPDHTLKPALFDLLDATSQTGVTLTESMAMLPASSVSGFYFAHPDSQYFGVARIGRDQLEDYAARRGISVDEAERWLRPNL